MSGLDSEAKKELRASVAAIEALLSSHSDSDVGATVSRMRETIPETVFSLALKYPDLKDSEGSDLFKDAFESSRESEVFKKFVTFLRKNLPSFQNYILSTEGGPNTEVFNQEKSLSRFVFSQWLGIQGKFVVCRVSFMAGIPGHEAFYSDETPTGLLSISANFAEATAGTLLALRELGIRPTSEMLGGNLVAITERLEEQCRKIRDALKSS